MDMDTKQQSQNNLKSAPTHTSGAPAPDGLASPGVPTASGGGLAPDAALGPYTQGPGADKSLRDFHPRVQSAPIGVFDSGLGGLTAVRELRRILPGEDIVYFGDTGRVPYGTKGRDIIISYTRQDIAFLLSRGVKTVLAACGTASSTFPPEEGAALPVGYMGVVAPTAEAAAAITTGGRIGVIGTPATVASKSYKKALEALLPGVKTTQAACPLFVPLVENGHFAPGDPMVKLAVEEYLAPFKAAKVDTLVLGCTHYPLLSAAISEYLGEQVTLVDSGQEAALALRDELGRRNLLNPRRSGGATEYFVSDAPERFGQLADILLGAGAGRGAAAKHVNIEKYDLRRTLAASQPGAE